MEQWEAQAPDPGRYPYPPCLKHHPSMGLNMFDAGRLHQMRSGMSYLCAQNSWDNDDTTRCPSCNESQEPFEHAIPSYLVRAPARTCHLQAVSDLGSDTTVWSSAALSRLIRLTKTSFPLGIFSRPTSATGSLASPLSDLVSFGYFMASEES